MPVPATTPHQLHPAVKTGAERRCQGSTPIYDASVTVKLLSGVGVVKARVKDPISGTEPFRFLGTCFAYKEPWFFLTAEHCVRGFAAHDLTVDAPGGSGSPHPVGQVHTLDGSDLAVLRSPDHGPWMTNVDPYREIQHEYELAQDFVSFGFTSETITTFGGLPKANQPTPRIFKGHFVQLLTFTDPLGRNYVASEMNIPAPDGLSGAPVFPPGRPYVVTAMVTGEKSTFTIPERVEETTDEGHISVTEVRRQVSYGIALMLHTVSAWIESELETGPAPTG